MKYKINLISCNLNLNRNVNIRVVYDTLKRTMNSIKHKIDIIYLKIDNESCGIYNNEKNAFSNQVTISINDKGDKFTVKLFHNGNIQICGCESVDRVDMVLQKLLNIISKIKGNIQTDDIYIEKGILRYKNYILDLGGNIRGYINNKSSIKLYGRSMIYDSTLDYLFHKKSKNEFYLYNNNLEKCGICHHELYHGRKNISKKFIIDYNSTVYGEIDTVISYNIINKYNGSVVGKKIYTIKSDMINEYPIIPKNVKYNIFDEDTKFNNMEYTISTLNVKYCIDIKDNEFIDLEKMANVIMNNGIYCFYNQTVSRSIYMIYSININEDGICTCKDFVECICDNIKIEIFNRGNVKLSNIKCEYQVENILNRLKDIIELYRHEIIISDSGIVEPDTIYTFNDIYNKIVIN